MKVRDLTDVIGKYGPWQRQIFGIVFFVALLVAWQHMVVPFVAPNVDFWCERPGDLKNMSVSQWRNLSAPLVDKNGKQDFSQCDRFVFEESDPFANVNYTKTVRCESWEYDRSVYKKTITEEWDLVCGDSWKVSMAQSSYMLGNLVSALCLSMLSDRFGRRPMILMAAFFLFVAGIICAFSPSFVVFAVCRFLLALGTTGLFLNDFVILMEVVGPKLRPILGVALELGWATGYVLLPGIAYLLRDWMYIQLAITVPVVSLISLYWLMPESPRWLIMNGKLDAAKVIILKAAKVNKLNVDKLDESITILSESVTKEQEALFEKRRPTIFDLMKTRNLRTKTLVIYYNWFVNAFIFYGLSLNTNELEGDPFLNFAISGVVEFPAYIISIFILKYLGRRYPQMAFMVIGGLACIATIPVPDDLAWLKTTLAMVGKFCITASYAVIYVYSAEVYPTVVRTVGMGSSSLWSKIGSIIAPFTRELGRLTSPSVPFWLYGGLSISSGLLILLLPETHNRKLPDTLEEAENFDILKMPEDEAEMTSLNNVER